LWLARASTGYAQRAMTLTRALLFIALLLNSCGGKTLTPNASQHELDQRHCTANTECASGLCSNGRCG
jgi:hypothetical protein